MCVNERIHASSDEMENITENSMCMSWGRLGYIIQLLTSMRKT